MSQPSSHASRGNSAAAWYSIWAIEGAGKGRRSGEADRVMTGRVAVLRAYGGVFELREYPVPEES